MKIQIRHIVSGINPSDTGMYGREEVRRVTRTDITHPRTIAGPGQGMEQ